jgi:hypothetical protein
VETIGHYVLTNILQDTLEGYALSKYTEQLEKRCEELQEQLSNELTKQHVYTPRWSNGAYIFMGIHLAQIYKVDKNYNISYGVHVLVSDTETGIIMEGTRGKSLSQCKEHVEKVMFNVILRKLKNE